jgi:hypothetical protein
MLERPVIHKIDLSGSLTHKIESRGMVTAMYPRMTVHAGFPEHGTTDACAGIEIIKLIAMRVPGVWLSMALLAELRCSPHQRTRMDRTVCIMTDRALLEDRLMFPQERPAFLGMTGVAIIVDRYLAQFRLARRLMCLVTVVALHLPVTKWMTELL